MVRQNIKNLRKTLRLSQSKFGEKLGVSRDVISNIEYGRVEPKDVFLNHVCTVFGISKEWLLGGAGEPFNPDLQLKENLDRAISLFSSLNPRWQDYALQQLRVLLELQNNEEDL